METPQTQETPGRDGRGKPAKSVTITLHNMPVADLGLVATLQVKRIKQTGEDVPRERIFSEALQHYAKVLSGQEA